MPVVSGCLGSLAPIMLAALRRKGRKRAVANPIEGPDAAAVRVPATGASRLIVATHRVAPDARRNKGIMPVYRRSRGLRPMFHSEGIGRAG
jgi:hypothetical protein